MLTETVVRYGVLSFPPRRVVDVLLLALGVSLDTDGVSLTTDKKEETVGTWPYTSDEVTLTWTLTGAAGAELSVEAFSSQLDAPVDADEVLTVTVGAADPERLAAALAALDALVPK